MKVHSFNLSKHVGVIMKKRKLFGYRAAEAELKRKELILILYDAIKDPGLKLYVITVINLLVLTVLALSGFFTDEPN